MTIPSPLFRIVGKAERYTVLSVDRLPSQGKLTLVMRNDTTNTERRLEGMMGISIPAPGSKIDYFEPNCFGRFLDWVCTKLFLLSVAVHRRIRAIPFWRSVANFEPLALYVQESGFYHLLCFKCNAPFSTESGQQNRCDVCRQENDK